MLKAKILATQQKVSKSKVETRSEKQMFKLGAEMLDATASNKTQID